MNYKNGIDPKNIVASFSPSRIYGFLKVSPLLLISIVLMLLAVFYHPVLIFISIITSFVAWFKYLTILFIKYTLTTETLTVRTGIIARKFNNLELYRVKDYVVTQSVIERVFKLMTVTLISTDTSSPEIRLVGIPLSDITETIRDLVQQTRNNNKIFEIN